MGNGIAGSSDQNQKVVDEFLLWLKKMYDNGEGANHQAARQMLSHGNGGQDDSMSHRSGPHSYNETNTIGSANQMQVSREKAAGMLRQSNKLAQAAVNLGGCRPSLGVRPGAGLAHEQ